MKTENLAYHNHYQHYLANNNNNRSANKTTAGLNPSGRLSFKANPLPVAKTMGEKLARNKMFNKFLDILADNSLMADALIALGLTTIARPASIYVIPTKDPVEKRKNNYVCQWRRFFSRNATICKLATYQRKPKMDHGIF